MYGSRMAQNWGEGSGKVIGWGGTQVKGHSNILARQQVCDHRKEHLFQ